MCVGKCGQEAFKTIQERLSLDALTNARKRGIEASHRLKYFVFLPQNAPAHSEVPPVGCGGRHLARGAQEAEKTHVVPFATHLSYSLEHGTADMSKDRKLWK